MVKQNNFINKAIMNTQESFITLERNIIDIFVNCNEIRKSLNLEKAFMEKSLTALADYLMKGIESDIPNMDQIIEMITKFAGTSLVEILVIPSKIGKLIKPIESQLTIINLISEEMRGIKCKNQEQGQDRIQQQWDLIQNYGLKENIKRMMKCLGMLTLIQEKLQKLTQIQN
jgi:hypothetical protein